MHMKILITDEEWSYQLFIFNEWLKADLLEQKRINSGQVAL